MKTESCARTHASATDTLVIERGEGVYVFDSAGKRYLEGYAGVRCSSLGYGNRELIAVANQQKGLLAAVELVCNKDNGTGYPPSVACLMQNACAKAGLIGRAVAGSAFALCPPLIITEAQVDELLEKLAAGLNETLVHVEKEGLMLAV